MIYRIYSVHLVYPVIILVAIYNFFHLIFNRSKKDANLPINGFAGEINFLKQHVTYLTAVRQNCGMKIISRKFGEDTMSIW
jgi:hypothetical protein